MMMLVSQAPENDIDAFMAKVLARRDVNWDQYYEYFGKERTELIVEGSLPGVPLMGLSQGVPVVRARRLHGALSGLGRRR